MFAECSCGDINLPTYSPGGKSGARWRAWGSHVGQAAECSERATCSRSSGAGREAAEACARSGLLVGAARSPSASPLRTRSEIEKRHTVCVAAEPAKTQRLLGREGLDLRVPAPAHDVPRRLAAETGCAAVAEVDGVLADAQVAIAVAGGLAADCD